MKKNEGLIFKYLIPAIGLILTLASIIFAIYVFIYQEKQRNLDMSLDVIYSENLFMLNDDIENFDVIYNNQSLKDSSQTVKILYLELKNSGATILQTYYDENIPFELIVKNATIVKYQVTDASNDFLKNIKTTVVSDSSNSNIILQKTIFEKDNFIAFKLYIFCDKDWDINNLKVNARIAGLKEIPINKASYVKSDHTQSLSFLFMIYFIFLFALLTILIISSIITLIVEKRQIKKRNEKIIVFFEKKDENEINNKLKIFMLYMRNYHERIISALLENNYVIDIFSYYEKHSTLIEKIYCLILPHDLFITVFQNTIFRSFPKDIFTIKDRQISLNEPYKNILDEFYSSKKAV